MKKKYNFIAMCLLFFIEITCASTVPIPDMGMLSYPNEDSLYYCRYGIWYRTNEPHNNTFSKPFIIVSGFDPSNVIKISENDKNNLGSEGDDTPEEKKIYLYNIANKDNFLDNLRQQGYDIIAYRCVNSTASIINNGDNLISFIDSIVIPNMSADGQTVMVGASMGGLLVRYALTKMEYDNKDHKCGLFVSLDSPQEGANIPLGFQHLVAAMNEMLPPFSIPELQNGQVTLDCDAAQEMLLYHHLGTAGDKAGHSSKRTSFLNIMKMLGNFPKVPLSFAISQGSGAGINQGFNANESVLKIDRTSLVDVPVFGPNMDLTSVVSAAALLGSIQLHAAPLNFFGVTDEDYASGLFPVVLKANMKSIPNTDKSHLFNLRLGVDFNMELLVPYWLPPFFKLTSIWIEIHDIYKKDVYVNNTMPIDNAPGTFKGMHNLQDFNVSEDIINVLRLLKIGNIDSHNDCFIPSYSALGLSDLANNPHEHIHYYLQKQGIDKIVPLNNFFYCNKDKNTSNFDFMHIERTNLDHIYDKNHVSKLTSSMLGSIEYLLPLSLSLENNYYKNNFNSENNPLKLSALGTSLPAGIGESVLEICRMDTSLSDYSVIRDNFNSLGRSSLTGTPNTIDISYSDIVFGGNISFAEYLGRPLKFRSKKSVNGHSVYSNVIDSIKFHPVGFNLSVVENKRTSCDNMRYLEIFVEKPEHAKYIYLPQTSGGRYAWYIIDTLRRITVKIDSIIPTPNINQFYLKPNDISVFEVSYNRNWFLQLREAGAVEQKTSLFPFTVLGRPSRIVTNQMSYKPYTINGRDYHLPDTVHKYAMLQISDPNYISHHRVPYQIIQNDEVISTVYQPAASTYTALSKSKQDSLQAEFDVYFNNNYKDNRNARLAFAKTQEGLILSENVTRIAMPDNGTFFLYTNGNNRLYKANLLGSKITGTTALVSSESVTGIEVTPDGAYAVYKRYNTDGLYKLRLTGSIPSTGTKIGDNSWASTEIFTEIPNHIYKNSNGDYLAVVPDVRNLKIYSYPVTGGSAVVVMDLTPGITSLPSGNMPSSLHGIGVSPLGHLFALRLNSGQFGEYYTAKRNLRTMSPLTVFNTNKNTRECNLFSSGYYTLQHQNMTTSDPCLNSPHTTNTSLYRIVERCITTDNCSQLPGQDLYCDVHVSVDSFRCYDMNTIRMVDVSPDSSFIIVSGITNNIYKEYKITASGVSTLSGSNTKISPNGKILVFSNDNKIYRDSASVRNLISDSRSGSNFCFSGNGNYVLYIDKASGFVYKNFVSDNAAIAETDTLYREYHWQAFLMKRLGTKVISNKIALNVPPVQWTLRDADGCIYDNFSIKVTAPETPSIKYTTDTINKKATITYNGGGAPPYFYNGQQLKTGVPFIVTDLKYGDNIITLFDSMYNESSNIIIKLSDKGITTVSTVEQTSETPNGQITINTNGIGARSTYSATLVNYPYTRYSSNMNRTVKGLPAGVYKVSVYSMPNVFSKETYYEVPSRIFSIKNITATNSCLLNGDDGSIDVVFENYSDASKCYINGIEYGIINGKVTVTNLPAGQYAIRSENSGYIIYDTVYIFKPDFSGTLKMDYTGEMCRINGNDIYGNALFNDYVFRLRCDTGIIAMSKQLVITVPNGNYALEAYNPKTGDATTLYTITKQPPLHYDLFITSPLCTDDSGTIDILLDSIVTGHNALLQIGDTNIVYSGQSLTFRLPPSMAGKTNFSIQYNENYSVSAGNMNINFTNKQYIDTFFITPSEVYGLVRGTDITCAGLDNGSVWLEFLNGGSGEYQYKIGDREWYGGADTIKNVTSGIYAVYLQDRKHLCSVIQLDSISITEQEKINIDTIIVGNPTNREHNGYLGAYISGGSGNYKVLWSYANDTQNTPYSDENYVVFGDTLQEGVYHLMVIDDKGCAVSKEVSLINVNTATTDILNVDKNQTLAAYPNPTNGVVYIDGIAENEKVYVYNLKGAFMFGTAGNMLDFSIYPSGVYFIRAGNRTVKIIKK